MENSEFMRLLAPVDDLLFNVIKKDVKDREIAMEVYHEVIVLAMVNFHKLRDPAKFAAWIITIAKNAARTRLKKELRRQANESVTDFDDPLNLPLLRDHGAGTESLVIDKDERSRLYKAIEALEEEERRVILLNFHARMHLTDIAGLLDMKLSSVKRCKRQALKKLRIFLEN